MDNGILQGKYYSTSFHGQLPVQLHGFAKEPLSPRCCTCDLFISALLQRYEIV
ncbi:hypothetical protein K435DRAFT_218112 [Dendrothele bispora CBS 962.96]|uniref:Uncharacterized protein n=1 Tax=Dendrothele bispora (strain CBS 962.96) TaxID=1314807 RepID=A0A4S8LRX5_DENBC|nr:hypothetical protein K435DRAFT_218112 [Dendrothele bispora CBS 962.96]